MRRFSRDVDSWMPGVSRKIICAPSRFTTPSTELRVVCGFSDTIASFPPTSALSKVDLPALGRPTIETKPDRKPAASGMRFFFHFRNPNLFHLQLVARQHFNSNTLPLNLLANVRHAPQPFRHHPAD